MGGGTVSGETTVLAPPPEGKDELRIHQAIDAVVRKVVVNAAIHRPRSDIMREVYIAGLYHGMKFSGPAPRKPDYLDITPTPNRRGRVRKAQP